jgi:hypothetical protein
MKVLIMKASHLTSKEREMFKEASKVMQIASMYGFM